MLFVLKVALFASLPVAGPAVQNAPLIDESVNQLEQLVKTACRQAAVADWQKCFSAIKFSKVCFFLKCISQKCILQKFVVKRQLTDWERLQTGGGGVLGVNVFFQVYFSDVYFYTVNV